jgi:hypothetical protein
MERQATKFVSAEEEAEQRKRELSDLKAKKDTINIPAVGQTSNDSEIVTIPIETVTSLIGDSNDTDLCVNKPVEVSQDIEQANPFASPSSKRFTSISEKYNEAISQSAFTSPTALATPRKRGSILDSANPSLINCLNSMFSPETSSRSSISGMPSLNKTPSKISARRGTVFSPSSIKIVDGFEGKTDEEKKEIKTTRSKLLQVRVDKHAKQQIQSRCINHEYSTV